jgi:hypothetical protein
LTSILATGQPNRTKSPRTESGDPRQHTSQGDCRFGTRDPGHSRHGNGHLERGSRCNRRVAAKCGDQTASVVHDHPAKQPAVGGLQKGYAVVQSCYPAADSVGAADLAALLLAAVVAVVVLQRCPAADAVVAVADPAGLSLAAVVVVVVVAAVLQSCLAADAVVAVADVVARRLAVVVAGAADLAADWVAAGLVLRVWSAAVPDPSVYLAAPDVSPPEHSIRELGIQLIYQQLELISSFCLH